MFISSSTSANQKRLLEHSYLLHRISREPSHSSRPTGLAHAHSSGWLFRGRRVSDDLRKRQCQPWRRPSRRRLRVSSGRFPASCTSVSALGKRLEFGGRPTSRGRVLPLQLIARHRHQYEPVSVVRTRLCRGGKTGNEPIMGLKGSYQGPGLRCHRYGIACASAVTVASCGPVPSMIAANVRGGMNASGVRRRMCRSTLPSRPAISAND
jgi:hypothetical protein